MRLSSGGWQAPLAGALAMSALAFAATPTAQAGLVASPQQSIAFLNAEREAHGIPGGIVERPDWSDACRKHMAYLGAHPGSGHDEDPSKLGYTPEGAWAGANSVLITPTGWTAPDGINPWGNAPIHHVQLLNPSLRQMGVWGGCATTWPGIERGATGDALFTYPGPGKLSRFRQNAYEDPFVPGDFVGLPRGTWTGPHLYVLYGGSEAPRVTSATLTGPDGPVEVRTVDSQHPEVGGSLGGASIVIPVRPLRPNAQYTASVGLDVAGRPLSKQWSFSTEASSPESSLSAGEEIAVLRSRSPAPALVRVVGRDGQVAAEGTVTAALPGASTSTRDRRRRRRPPTGTVPAGAWKHGLPAGKWTFCWVQPPIGEYDGASGCEKVAFRARPAVKLKRLRRRGLFFRYRLTVADEVVGRTARIRVGRSVRRCSTGGRRADRRFAAQLYRRCVLRGPWWKAKRRRLRRTQIVRVRQVNRGGRIAVRVLTPAFSRGDVGYRATVTKHSFRQR